MPNSFTDLFEIIKRLMIGQEAAFFQEQGNNLYRSIMFIMICLFIFRSLAHREFNVGHFMELLWAIGLGGMILWYYSNPMPFFGISFSDLIVGWGAGLADQLNDKMVTKVIARLTTVYLGLETPGLTAVAFNTVEVVRWLVTSLLLLGSAAAVYVIIAFGYIAQATLVLLGPVFIPFCIVPKFEQLFWGWLFALIQYAFYPVVANAYLFIFGNMLINFVDSAGTDYSTAGIAVLFLPLVVMLLAFVVGILKIPSLTNSMLTGRSGESTLVPRWAV